MAGASTALENENHQRDAEFNKALHGKSSAATGGISAMFAKDRDAKKLAVDEYFKHFDNKTAAEETAEDREASSLNNPYIASAYLGRVLWLGR